MAKERWQECRHHHEGCACREHTWEERVAQLEAEIARLTKLLDVCCEVHNLNAALKAEVAQLAENCAALRDEFNRGAALAQKLCPKPTLGHSVFEGIPLLAEKVAQLEAEVERLKAGPTVDAESKVPTLGMHCDFDGLRRNLAYAYNDHCDALVDANADEALRESCVAIGNVIAGLLALEDDRFGVEGLYRIVALNDPFGND